MNMKDYLILSGRTAAGDMNRADFPEDRQLLREMNALDMAGGMADTLKRNLYYKDNLFARAEKQRLRIEQQGMALNMTETKVAMDHIHSDLVHSALGIMSEAGELIEAIITSAIDGKGDVDKVNLQEEAGDILWYTAMLLRYLGVDFETVAAQNIAKLQARYPEKFTSEDAINRDLDAERKVLESQQ